MTRRRSNDKSTAKRRRGLPEWPKPRPPDKLIAPQESITFTVHPNQGGMRLDQVLAVKIKYLSRNRIQQMIEEREITIDCCRVGRAHRVRAYDEIRVPLPAPSEDAYNIDKIPLDIIYEDELFIILNKQPGIVVHPSGRHLYDTLINALHLRYRDLDDEAKDVVPKLAHRIDRETSGVLVAVKTARHERGSPLVFENTEVVKEYLALVEGVIERDEFEVDAPMCKEPGKNPNLAPMVVHATGLTTRTAFRVMERFEGFTLLHCRLFTGRQHQIRVHLQHTGHPVVCDKMYGQRDELWLSDVQEWQPDARNRLLLERQALHSFRLTFPHPQTGKSITFEAPLATDMRETLEALQTK